MTDFLYDVADKSPLYPLQIARDYYLEGRLWVFTTHFLTKRGYCCGSGCRHCPYRLQNLKK